jgi:hypothetical protein
MKPLGLIAGKPAPTMMCGTPEQEVSIMHTALVITFGLVLLALMLFIGQRLGASRQVLVTCFVGIWLVLSAVNGAIGVVTAGQPLVSELVIGSVVFGAPVVALALFISRA